MGCHDYILRRHDDILRRRDYVLGISFSVFSLSQLYWIYPSMQYLRCHDYIRRRRDYVLGVFQCHLNGLYFCCCCCFQIRWSYCHILHHSGLCICWIVYLYLFHNIVVMVITVGTNSRCSAVFKTFNFSPVVLLIDS